MSLFLVEWLPAALEELARLWLLASDPEAITKAQNEADQLLARDPIKYGRHLSEGLFRLEVQPLILNYTIDFQNRRVEVGWVRTA
jgi:hypothetical protein